VPATTVDAYLKSLPADRREAISAVRDAVNAKLPIGYVETIQYGMIAWCVPESVLPAKDVYNKQPLCLASLGSQKNHMALYMLGVYGDENERRWFESAYKKAGKKLDMGKSCLRFRSLDALALDVVSEAMSRVTVDKYVGAYRAIRAAMKPTPRAEIAKKAKPAKKPAAMPAKKPNSGSAKKRASKK